MTNIIRVKYDVFDGITGGESGGVFNIESKRVFVFSSVLLGGCIYAYKSYTNIENSLFCDCCVKTCKDHYYGNILYCKESYETKINCKESYETLYSFDAMEEYKLLEEFSCPNFDYIPSIQKQQIIQKVCIFVPDTDHQRNQGLR